MTSNRHCLHSLLPKLRHAKALTSLRNRGHNYELQQIEFNLRTWTFFTTTSYTSRTYHKIQ